MSDFSVVLHKAEAWLSEVFGATPASSAISAASQALTTAVASVETAVPAIATAAANAALALIPGGLGSEFDALADSLIDEVVAILQAKKSTATPAAAAASVAVPVNAPAPAVA